MTDPATPAPGWAGPPGAGSPPAETGRGRCPCAGPPCGARHPRCTAIRARRSRNQPSPSGVRGRPMDRAAELAEIANEIETHLPCGFEPCETCTHFVPGEGSAHARIVIVGEAPGASEDKAGRPVVGR